DGALRVRHRRRGEDHACHDENQWGQTQGERCGDAERVVDRRADVAVDGGEKARRAEDALETDLLAPSTRHGRDSTRAQQREGRPWRPWRFAMDGGLRGELAVPCGPVGECTPMAGPMVRAPARAEQVVARSAGEERPAPRVVVAGTADVLACDPDGV